MIIIAGIIEGNYVSVCMYRANCVLEANCLFSLATMRSKEHKYKYSTFSRKVVNFRGRLQTKITKMMWKIRAADNYYFYLLLLSTLQAEMCAYFVSIFILNFRYSIGT